MNKKEIIKRFAQLYFLSYDDAAALVDDENEDEVMHKITSYIAQQIKSKSKIVLNRKQKRKLMKKAGKQGRNQLNMISDTSTKRGYIDLIQKLRKLNEQKEKEENDNAIENN